MFGNRSYLPLVAVLAVGTAVFTALLLIPRSIHVTHESDAWVDLLRAFVLKEKAAEQPAGAFEPYLGQLALVHHLVRSGDRLGAYTAMNRFMDMLEAREGGLSDEAAEAIWEYCYQVTPAHYHDVSRHQRADWKHLQKLQSYGDPPLL
ncbi:MAG TPA: hypothetical protein VNK46_02565 [Nitrospiraceae bacterium]|nr:hypothetical protein [Nitrospiraceae bacterium]